jgi:IS30 family transposase
LGRSPSTVSRELVRNGGRHRYRAQAPTPPRSGWS